MRFFVLADGQERGPFEQGELLDLLNQGAIDRSLSVRPEEGGPAVTLARLFPAGSQASTPAIQAGPERVAAGPEYAASTEMPATPVSSRSAVRLPDLAGSAVIAALAVFFFARRNGWTFFDGIDLVIHEAGHPIFAVGGEFLQFAGGTVLQLLVPIGFGVYFMRRLAAFPVQFCLLWLGQSLLNVARYVADATAMQLELVGGGEHDWNYMLGRLNLLSQDRAIAGVITFVAVLAFVLAVFWPWVARNSGQADSAENGI